MSEIATYKPLTETPPALAELKTPSYQQSQSTLDKLIVPDEEAQETQEVVETPETQETPVETVETPNAPQTEETVEETQEQETTEKTPEPDLEIPDPLSDKVETVAKTQEVEETEDETEINKKWEEASKSQKKQKEAFIHLSRSERKARKEARELQQKVQELESRISNAEPPPEVTAKITTYESEINRLKQESQELRQKIAVAAVEQDPDYQKEVVTPWNEHIVPELRVIEKATNGEVNMAVANAIAMEPDPVARKEKLYALKESMERDDWNNLSSVVTKMREVILKNTEYKKNAEKHLTLKQQEEEEKRKQFVQQYEQNARKTFQETAQRFTQQFIGEADDPQIQNALKASQEKAESFPWFDATPEVQGTVRAALGVYPVALAVAQRQLQKERDKVTKLEKEIEQYKAATKRVAGASPSAGGTTARAPKPAEGEKEIDLKNLSVDKLFRMANE